MRHLIFCEVWGGMTGYRSGYLKHDNKFVEFNSFDEAEREAQRLNREKNGNPHRTADFHYSVHEA